MKNRWFHVVIFLVVTALTLAACAPTATATTVPPVAPTAPTGQQAYPATAIVPTTSAQQAYPATQVAPTTAPTVAPTALAVAPTAPKPTAPPPNCAKLANMPTVAAGSFGAPDKPIVMAFVPSGEAGKIAAASTAIADCLTQMTGLSYQVQTGTSYAAAIEAMGAEQAQVGFLNTFSILIAEQKYGIVPALANERNYVTNDLDPDKNLAGQLEPFYKGQFIANVNSGITKLADLKGKTFCYVDPNSTSGYIIPNIIFKANGIDPTKDFKATQNAGSHPNVAIAVYKGDCDAGITFVNVLTDKAANLQAKYADITDKVKVFALTDRIPNDGVQYIKTLDPKVQDATTQALLAMSADPGGKAVLASLYTINAFEKIDKTFYDPFLQLLQKAGVDPASMVK